MFPGDFDSNDPYGKLLSRRGVHRYLKKRVGKYGLPSADAKDVVAQVYEVLWKRREDPGRPHDMARLIALAGTVFEGKLTDYFRRKDVDRRRRVDGPSLMGAADREEHGAHPREQPNYVDEIAPSRSMTPSDSLEAKEQLAFVKDQMNRGVLTHDDVEVMEAQHSGERTYEELAAERGVNTDALRQRIHRVRARMIKAWLEYSLFTKAWTIAFLILLFLVVVTIVVAAIRRRQPPPPPEPPPAPTVTQLPPAPTAAPKPTEPIPQDFAPRDLKRPEK